MIKSRNWPIKPFLFELKIKIMKFCPKCEARYEEEILRFCMKDGTPLVSEEEPSFIEMPSGSIEGSGEDDDAGEITVIRRESAVPKPPPVIDEDFSFTPPRPSSPRIVVPMTPEANIPQRPRAVPQYQPAPKPNTLKVVILTMFGTTTLLALGAGGFWFLQKDAAFNSNSNANANNVNVNMAVNTNLGAGSGFDFNTNANFAANSNANANPATPTPTPKPSATPTPTETPEANTAAKTPSPTPSGSPAGTPLSLPSPVIIRPGPPPVPRPSPTPTNRNTNRDN